MDWDKNIHPNWMKITKTLEAERKRQGLSCYKLALISGMKGKRINDWEAHNRAINIDSLVRWADALGYNVELVKKEEK